jgi:hypothetical protein
MYKILILSGKSFFGGAQASAMAEYLSFEGIPHVIISANIGNINSILFNQLYSSITLMQPIQLGEMIKDFWKKEGTEYYKVEDNKLMLKAIFDSLNKPFINKTIDTLMIFKPLIFNYNNIEDLIRASINIPGIVKFGRSNVHPTSYEVSNLTKVVSPMLTREQIDPVMDKLKVTVIYNSNKNGFISEEVNSYTTTNRLLASMVNESNELYHITKFFTNHEVNIIRVPAFYNIDIPKYDYEWYEQLGMEAYLNSINY